jgi:hypothetical protein
MLYEASCSSNNRQLLSSQSMWGMVFHCLYSSPFLTCLITVPKHGLRVHKLALAHMHSMHTCIVRIHTKHIPHTHARMCIEYSPGLCDHRNIGQSGGNSASYQWLLKFLYDVCDLRAPLLGCTCSCISKRRACFYVVSLQVHAPCGNAWCT